MKSDRRKGPLILGAWGKVMRRLIGKEGKRRNVGMGAVRTLQTWTPSVAQAHFQSRPFPPPGLEVLLRPNTSKLFSVRVNNNSYYSVNVPKGRKCGSCSHFPLSVIKQLFCQFFLKSGILLENRGELWNGSLREDCSLSLGARNKTRIQLRGQRSHFREAVTGELAITQRRGRRCRTETPWRSVTSGRFWKKQKP